MRAAYACATWSGLSAGATPIMLSRVTSLSSCSSVQPSVPTGRAGMTMYLRSNSSTHCITQQAHCLKLILSTYPAVGHLLPCMCTLHSWHPLHGHIFQRHTLHEAVNASLRPFNCLAQPSRSLHHPAPEICCGVVHMYGCAVGQDSAKLSQETTWVTYSTCPVGPATSCNTQHNTH
jgi:hypothetical protein